MENNQERLIPLDLPRWDKESLATPKFSFVNGALTLVYKNPAREAVTITFRKVLSFRWLDESQSRPTLPNRLGSQVTNSLWLRELLAAHDAEFKSWEYERDWENRPLRHFRLNFELLGVLEIACDGAE